MKNSTLSTINQLIESTIEDLSLDDKVNFINQVRQTLHEHSPFKSEPVDFVKWVKNETVYANDYNPNSVAPPEMKLLQTSIDADGYTQPIVTMPDNDEKYEVIDGFHRHRVGKEVEVVRNRINGYLPLVMINESRYDKADRMAATIRHNRARGKHSVNAMSDIVIELKRRNWSDEKIAKNLGMEADEVLRLTQISGLTEMFSDAEFSMSWDIDDISEDTTKQDTEDQLDDTVDITTKPSDRIFHTWEKWECYKAGFYENHPPAGMTKDDCELMYKNLLTNDKAFKKALGKVIKEWKNSCEHYLTNDKMNRIAWLGQASLCYAHGIPSMFRGGFNLLSEKEQDNANNIALEYLNKWLKENGRKELTSEEAQSKSQADLY